MKKNVAIVISSPMMVNFFLIGQLNHLSSSFNVTLITSSSDQQVALNHREISKSINIITIGMERKVAFFSDIATLINLIKIFYVKKFDIVHSISPKSGFLAQLAAFLLGINIRVHTFTGQVWVSKTGLWRQALKFIDLLIVKASTNILVDSYSQRSFLMNENLVNHNNSRVLLNGSISGINDKRFIESPASYNSFRLKNNLDADSIIILFIGRLTKDKGVVSLLEAFKVVEKSFKNCYLVFVGPDEENVVSEYLEPKSSKSNIIYFNYTDEPEYFMQASDILCLPSLREGFGNVVLEAALCGVPSIVSEIYGLKDVVEKNVTALTFPPLRTDCLAEAIIDLLSDEKKRKKMGLKAKERATYLFSSFSVNQELIKFYEEMLEENATL